MPILYTEISNSSLNSHVYWDSLYYPHSKLELTFLNEKNEARPYSLTCINAMFSDVAIRFNNKFYLLSNA